MRRVRAEARVRRGVAHLLLVALMGWGCGDSETGPARVEPAPADTPAFSAMADRIEPGPGRSVWVRVLDRNAVPIDGATVYARVEPERVVPATAIRAGEHRVDGIVGDRVEIWVEVAGKRHGIDHPVSNSRATLVLPVGGRLDVVWGLPQLEDLPVGSLHLVVSARRDPEVHFELDLERDPTHRGSVQIPYMMPGEYLVGLELWRVPEGERADYSPAKVLPLITPRVFYIAEGEATRIVLGAPTPVRSDAAQRVR